VRVVASTNQDIEAKIARGEFREDLFYRLNVVTVRMPSLEEIRSDIPLLIHHFLGKYRTEYERPEHEFSEEAIQLLLRRPWRGNVRELQNTINRAVLLGAGPTLDKKDLRLDVQAQCSTNAHPDLCFDQVQHLDYAGAKEAVLKEFTASYLAGRPGSHQGQYIPCRQKLRHGAPGPAAPAAALPDCDQRFSIIGCTVIAAETPPPPNTTISCRSPMPQ